jgi:hypothetical protein
MCAVRCDRQWKTPGELTNGSLSLNMTKKFDIGIVDQSFDRSAWRATNPSLHSRMTEKILYS